MIDNLAIALTHVLLAIGLWRVLLRDDLDRDPDDPAERSPFVRKLRRAPRTPRKD